MLNVYLKLKCSIWGINCKDKFYIFIVVVFVVVFVFC